MERKAGDAPIDETAEARRGPRFRARGPGLFLVAALVMFLGRGVFYCVALPYGDPLDEPYHFGYAAYLWQTGHPPASAAPSMADEITRPFRNFPWYPSFSSRAITWSSIVALPGAERLRRRDEAFAPGADRARWSGPNYESQQPPLAYLLTGWPLRLLPNARLSTRLLALRLAAVLVSAAGLPLLLPLCRRVAPEKPARCLFLAIAAFPGLGIFLGRYTNDAVAFPLIAAILLAALSVADGTFSGRRTLGAGLLLAAALWTKVYALTLVPLLPAAALLSPSLRRRKMIVRSSIAVVVALSLAAPWAIRQLRDSGSLSGLTEAKSARAAGVGVPEAVRAAPRLANAVVARVFWRTFLWPGTWSAIGAADAVAAILRVGMIAIALAVLLGKRPRPAERRRALVLAGAGGLFLGGQLYHAALFEATARALGKFAPAGTEGWYLLVMLGALVPAIVLFRRPASGPMLGAAALFFAADLAAVLGVLPLVYSDAARPIFHGAGLSQYAALLRAVPDAPRVLGAVSLGGSPGAIAAALLFWVGGAVAAAAGAIRARPPRGEESGSPDPA